MGLTSGVVIMVLITTGLALTGAYGFRLPSVWMLSAAKGAIADALQSVGVAVTHGLSLLFFTFLFKVFFRRAWLGVLAIIPIGFIFEPATPLAPAAHMLIFVPTILVFVYLLLRSGLLAVTAAIYSSYVLMYLPLTEDLSTPADAASILMLCSLTALAVFGFHSTLAGRPLLKLDL